MPATTKLTMYEELLLLALDDRKGTSAVGGMQGLAVGGAVLAELVLLGAVRIGEDKKQFVDAEPGAQVADPLLAECLALVVAAKKRRRAVEWVQKFSGLKDLNKRVARGLVSKGVLNEEQDRVLGLFPRTLFPARDGGPEQDLVRRLERAVLSDDPRVDERTLVVAVVANATGLLEKAVDKKQLKGRKERLKQLADGQLAGSATLEAVKAAQAAAAVAVIVAPTAATTAATSGG